jgi:CRISPR-associated endonuclease Csn1
MAAVKMQSMINETNLGPDCILGLDLGAESLGWQLVRLDSGGKPCEIVASGVRCFSAGVSGTHDEMVTGKDQSKAAPRRQARQIRRGLWRTRHRLTKLLRLLQSRGLLPDGPTATPQHIHDLLYKLDKDLESKYPPESNSPGEPSLPYRLRALAIEKEKELEPFAIGRAIYHLGHRRGFKSSRKRDPKPGDKESEYLAAVRNRTQALRDSGERTLGAMLSRQNRTAKKPSDVQRLRGQVFHRDLIENELRQIWNTQRELSPDGFKDIYEAMFYVRHLKDPRPGLCSIDRSQRRAPRSLRLHPRERLEA